MENFVFCPRCAGRLQIQIVGQRPQPVCADCGFVLYRDPKVAVIALVTCGERVLLARRAVEPEMGKWALPGGYMDAGEMPEVALRRELIEELALELDALRLLTILPMAGGRGIVLAYAADLLGITDGVCPNLTCADDVSEAGWFAAHEVPGELAFVSTAQLLAQWQEQYL